MYSFRKSKKGFTLVELMVVVAIIGILALLGLRLFLMQQIRAKNAIVKANAATVHTIIQGNLADMDYSVADANSDTDAQAAVNDVRTAAGVLLDDGEGLISDKPAGMKNPHLTDNTDIVVKSRADAADAAAFLLATDGLGATLYGTVQVAMETGTSNKFYIIGIDHEGNHLGDDVYVATK